MLNTISKLGIIPVIKLKSSEKAVPLAKALIEGGLPVAEVTFRTDAAADSIKKMVEAFPEMIVGAGTVLTVEQAELAKKSGARFIVSPGFNPKITAWCLENDILHLPGCTTASEIEGAMEMGLEAVKFFPAEQSGGIAKIKALSAPYHTMKFIPTGGINLDNLNDYLDNKCILACGGSFMVSDDLIEGSEWDKITLLTRRAVSRMLGHEIMHLGINCGTSDEAEETASTFSRLMTNAEIDDRGGGIFVGGKFEIMRPTGRGTHGHIAIKTNSCDRTVYYLEKQGFEFEYETAKYENGRLTFIYLKNEVAGFVVHFTQK